MNSGDNQGPDHDARKKIVNLMQSIENGPKKQTPPRNSTIKGAAAAWIRYSKPLQTPISKY